MRRSKPFFYRIKRVTVGALPLALQGALPLDPAPEARQAYNASGKGAFIIAGFFLESQIHHRNISPYEGLHGSPYFLA